MEALGEPWGHWEAPEAQSRERGTEAAPLPWLEGDKASWAHPTDPSFTEGPEGPVLCPAPCPEPPPQ